MSYGFKLVFFFFVFFTWDTEAFITVDGEEDILWINIQHIYIKWQMSKIHWKINNIIYDNLAYVFKLLLIFHFFIRG